MKPPNDIPLGNNLTSEERLFAAALEQAEADRKAFLVAACLGDLALQERVEALLRAHDATANPLATVRQTSLSSALPEFLLPVEEAAGETLGRYKLLEKLGEGGCGVVYVAEQTEPVRRRVALKIIKRGMETKAVIARFEAERQALALMDHPNIAKVLDAGATGSGRPYFVMELVRGIRITDYCDQNHLNTRARLDLFIKVCQAIQHAHQKGIIHRDIKPSNILVTLHDGVPVPKVIDFGIAKATEGRLTDHTVYTQLHQFIGTPAYMSPEQAEMSGLDIDTRSDIYSLGVLLYEVLTGRPPFDPKELMSQGIDGMRRTIREVEPARPSTRLATLSGQELTTTAQRRAVESAQLTHLVRGDLDWIVMKCLEKDRSRRYETANGLAADLRRHLDNEPVTARPPSTAYRLQKAWRRNRLAYSAGAAVVVVLAVALVFTLVSGHRTRAALRHAEAARAAEESQRRLAQAERVRADQQRIAAEANQLDSRRRAYAAAIVLAQQALAQDDLGRTRNLLIGQRPQPGERDLRGWEWRYLWGLARPDAHEILVQQPDALTSVAISPGGDRIAYTDQEGSVELMNLATRGVELRTKGAGYRGTTFRIMAFSPTEPLLAFHERLAENRCAVTVWDWEQRTNRFQLPAGEGVMTVVFSGDGQHLGVLDGRTGSTLYESKNGRQVRSWIQTNSLSYALSLSRDGQTQAIGFNDEQSESDTGWGKAMTATEGVATRPIISATPGMISTITLSRDGQVLATGAFGLDTEIKLWDVGSGALIRRLEGHRAYLHQLAFSPDNRLLASASADQTVRLWDWANGTCVGVLRGHLGEVWSLAFSADGKRLISASKDGTIRSWPVGHTNPRQASRTASRAGELAGFLENSRTLVTVSADGFVLFWDGTNQAPTRHIPLGLTNASCARLAADKRQILIGFDDGQLQEWDLVERRRLSDAHAGSTRVLDVRYRFGGAGWLVLVGNQVLAWGTNSAQPPTLLATGAGYHMEPVPNADAVLLVRSNRFEVWDIVRRELVAGFDTSRKVDRFSFSPDGQWLAASSYVPIGMATLWSWPGREIRGEFRQHLLGAHGLAFSPDSRRLATGSVGRDAVRVWDVVTQMELLTLAGGDLGFDRMEFSPDGNRLAALEQGFGLFVWTAPTWEEIAAEEAREASSAKAP
ncbi:MAG: serine/threonine protein kinase [Verrucomicrobiae bacterium]|nr:serine/threonine protein kinase [Verrucomicrobiae bacterium]